MKLNLPEKRDDRFWFHKDRKGNFDCIYNFYYKNLKSVIISDNGPDLNALILPKIDYGSFDADGFDNYKTVIDVLKGKNDSKQALYAFNCLIEAKYILNPNAIQIPNFCKSIPDTATNVIVTGNSTLKFFIDSFGKYSNINLILPKGMKLFKIKSVQNTYSTDIEKEYFVIGHAVLGRVNGTNDGKYGIFVEEIDSIDAYSSKISLDTSHFFDRISNEIRHCDKHLSV